MEAKEGSLCVAPLMLNLGSRQVSGTHQAAGAAVPGKRPQ